MTANLNALTTFAPKPLHSPLRWVVVGCGHIGRRHMEHISKHPQTQLVGMVDVLPASECGAAQFAEIPFYQSVESAEERPLMSRRSASPTGCTTQLLSS